MAFVEDIGVNSSLTIGGTAVPAILQGCTPDLQRALQPIIIANGGTPLAGYAPSSGAKSGFMTQFYLPYGTGIAAGIINACLASAGSTIILKSGASGGVSLVTCICETLRVSGSEGGMVECQATFQSVAFPTVGASNTPGTWTPPAGALIDLFSFADVISATLGAGTARTDVYSFTWEVAQRLILMRANSHSGLPKKIKVGVVTSQMSATYAKGDDTEGTAALGNCPAVADNTVIMTETCGSGPTTLTLTCSSAFADQYPRQSNQVEAWNQESWTGIASLGAYTAA